MMRTCTGLALCVLGLWFLSLSVGTVNSGYFLGATLVIGGFVYAFPKRRTHAR